MSTFIRSLLAILLLGLGAAATADFVVVTEAYEVPVSELRLPGVVNGTVTFRECKECDYRTIRVTAATSYQANGETLSLKDFRNALENVPNPSDATATVLHHLESDTIEGVQVWY